MFASKFDNEINMKIKIHKQRKGKDNLRKKVTAGHRWLTPVILATQEAEIRRITVRSQPRQIVRDILS
jgi:hypothetical protein